MNLPSCLPGKEIGASARSACLLNCRFIVICPQKVSEGGKKARKLDRSRDFFTPGFYDITGTFCSQSNKTGPLLANTLQRNGIAATCHEGIDSTNWRRPQINHLFLPWALRQTYPRPSERQSPLLAMTSRDNTAALCRDLVGYFLTHDLKNLFLISEKSFLNLVRIFFQSSR